MWLAHVLFSIKKISMAIFPCKTSCLHECMPVSTGLWLWKTLVSLHTILQLIMWHSVSNQMTAQYPWHADTCCPSWVMSTPRLLVSHSPGVWIIYNSQNDRTDYWIIYNSQNDRTDYWIIYNSQNDKTWGELHSVRLRHYTPVSQSGQQNIRKASQCETKTLLSLSLTKHQINYTEPINLQESGMILFFKLPKQSACVFSKLTFYLWYICFSTQSI